MWIRESLSTPGQACHMKLPQEPFPAAQGHNPLQSLAQEPPSTVPMWAPKHQTKHVTVRLCSSGTHLGRLCCHLGITWAFI